MTIEHARLRAQWFAGVALISLCGQNCVPAPGPAGAPVATAPDAASVVASAAVETMETYEDGLKRVHGDQCVGLWASLGTCDPWLAIAESSGYGGTISYYDINTRQIVAKKEYNDSGPQYERFVFGTVDCGEMVTSEVVPCSR